MPLYSYSDLQRKGAMLKIQESKRMVKKASQILSESALLFSEDDEYDIFLSHAYKDAHIILALKNDLEEMNYSVYVDWVDDFNLDRSKVSKKTAAVLRQRLKTCRSLFIAHTENVHSSKWVPWELGFFDGLKARVAILPISNEKNPGEGYSDAEFMGLYPYVTKTKAQSTHKETLWINNSESAYVQFDSWLKGKNPPIPARISTLLRKLNIKN